MLEEEKHRYEHQASCAASEVKAALDAHGDFAEALEAEQRLIVERLTEQLTKEAAQRHELMKRLGVVEMDVQKAGGWGHGSLNVPIEHHPTIRYMVYNGYYKVMSNIPKMGHLPTPGGWGFRWEDGSWMVMVRFFLGREKA